MRTSDQVLSQLLDFAARSAGIRAVVMNGSRVNPNAPRDRYQDYDVICYTHEPRAYLLDQTWIAQFGELVILQQNDYESHGVEGYIFLMQFTDGVRIDLAFEPLANLAHLGEDSLTEVLLDKDGAVPPLPPASDLGYHTRRPSQKEFDEAVNEIFWCAGNVAKGLKRGELVYVKYMFDVVVRKAFNDLLEWYAASRHGWTITTGAYGKWLERFLPPEVWQGLPATYAGAGFEENWDALFHMLRLTRTIGQALAAGLGYTYPLDDDCRTVEYLKQLRLL